MNWARKKSSWEDSGSSSGLDVDVFLQCAKR
jgi:hypothetical protein